MALKLEGMSNLRGKFGKFIEKKKMLIADFRKEVARELNDALLENIPVWSGRGIRSVHWGRGESAPVEGHPDRGGTALDGLFAFHPEFGKTSLMQLGEEPQRPAAEAIARASLESADYSIDKRVVVTMSAPHAGLINRAEAPKSNLARNKAVVSRIAIAQAKAMFAGIVK